MRLWLAGIVAGILVVALAGAWVLRRARDRNPDYALDLHIEAGPPAPLRAGFAAVPITPDVQDTWTDANGNARFDEGESFEDRNGNGRFDAFWLAGFHPRRPATGVHDNLWARAMAISDGRSTLAIVALDAIGLMHDEVIEIRRRLPQGLVDYAVVASTHTHQAPDLMGVWWPSRWERGVNEAYLERVLDGAARALREAAQDMRPARLELAEVSDAPSAYVTDSRRPIVLDAGLHILHATQVPGGEPLGTFVVWGNHPETTWSDNLLVSSDFPHFVRRFLEEGVRSGERLVAPGLSGTVVYASGAIGGLMTTLPDFAVRDPVTGDAYREPSFEKARAQGRALALLALQALRDGDPLVLREASLSLRARTVAVPLDNPALFAAALFGVVQRGFVRWGELRTEIAALRIGPATLLTVPGEIYPEIVHGGIESPPGADFEIEPQETPPLRELMPGRFRIVLGLANDEIGYIIPKSEWDDEPPWIYGADEESYGEIVSFGPETAPTLHAALRDLLADLD